MFYDAPVCNSRKYLWPPRVVLQIRTSHPLPNVEKNTPHHTNEKKYNALKGLSHEMNLAFDDMYDVWLVLGLSRGRGHSLNLYVLQ